MTEIVIQTTVHAWHEIPLGATVVSIDGVDVLGQCGGCTVPITHNDEYNRWADGVITCTDCGGPEK